MTPGETEPDLPASVGGSPAEAGGWLWLTVGTRTRAAEVLGSTPWRKPSQSLPLAPPKSPGRLQCWITSGQTSNRERTQPHPSAVKQIKVLLSSAHQRVGRLPTTSPSHQETSTSLLDSLSHQRADSRSKKNYNPAACGTKTTFTERQTRWKGRGLCTRCRNKIKPQKNNQMKWR